MIASALRRKADYFWLIWLKNKVENPPKALRKGSFNPFFHSKTTCSQVLNFGYNILHFSVGEYYRLLYPNSPRHPRQKYLLTVKGLSTYNELGKPVR
ncbi:MAG TPA: hypothetical protein DEQ17_02190 [Prevotella sp.]|nr:hypothetical protein [Prevotella sp.]